MTNITDLPYEIISQILSLAAEENLRDPDCVTFTYGITQAASRETPVHKKSNSSKHVRGHVPTDQLRWNAVNSFRQVCHVWHEWSLSYAVKELYIRRWRGGETWMRSVFNSTTSNSTDILPVVYQHPYKHIRSTARLFADYPAIARHVRRIWFNGIYRYDTVGHIFSILHNCTNIRSVSIPWTALRYGTEEDWLRLTSFPNFSSLEFLSVGLRDEILRDPQSYTNTSVLASSKLSFHNLRRFKLFGDANLTPITDADLIALSRTATNLREILIANCGSISIAGVASLIEASKDTLTLIDYTQPEHPAAAAAPVPHQTSREICTLIASCPKLRDLAISIPRLHSELFAHDAPWQETIRLRVADPEGLDNFKANLEEARRLVGRKQREGTQLGVEVAVGGWLCEVGERMVHGCFRGLEEEGALRQSVKGPYGYTGMRGEGQKGEWRCVGENAWEEMISQGRVALV